MRLFWTLTLLKVSVLGFSFTLGEPASGEVNIHFHLQEAREEEEQAKVEHGTDYSLLDVKECHQMGGLYNYEKKYCLIEPQKDRTGRRQLFSERDRIKESIAIANCMYDRKNTRGRKWDATKDYHEIPKTGTPQECKKKCDKNDRCQYWTWHYPAAGVHAHVCILMSDISEFYGENENAVSGYGKGCNEECPRYGGIYPNGLSIQPIDMQNRTKTFPKVSSWSYCSYLCSNTPGCVYWMWSKESCCVGSKCNCTALEKMCTLLSTAHFKNDPEVRALGYRYPWEINKHKKRHEDNKNKKKDKSKDVQTFHTNPIDVSKEFKFHGFIHGPDSCTGPRDFGEWVCEKVPLDNLNSCTDRDDCPGKAECKDSITRAMEKECDVNNLRNEDKCLDGCVSVEGAQLINPRGTILHNGEKLYTEGLTYQQCSDLCRQTSGCEWFTLYRKECIPDSLGCGCGRPSRHDISAGFCTLDEGLSPDRFNRCYLMDSRRGWKHSSKFKQFYNYVTGNRLCTNTAKDPQTIPRKPKRVTGYPPYGIWPQ